MASSSTSTRLRSMTRVVKLTYLQSVQVTSGIRSAGEIAGEGGGVGGVSSGHSSPGDPGFMGTGIGGSASESISTSSSDTGWVITRTWRETLFDKARYGIGIRDIGAFNYEYLDVSEIVSTRAISPLPISKVSLRVVEEIPRVYPVGKRWITYYISHDDGKMWLEINPLDFPDYADESGLIVPKIITFNADIGGPGDENNKYVETADPVTHVRFRAVLRQAQEGVDDPSRYSPILKEYSLLIYPAGGLRQGST